MIYKILRFQIVALPRLENWDVMIDGKICPIETEWRSIPFFRYGRSKDVLEGQFLFCPKLESTVLVGKYVVKCISGVIR